MSVKQPTVSMQFVRRVNAGTLTIGRDPSTGPPEADPIPPPEQTLPPPKDRDEDPPKGGG